MTETLFEINEQIANLRTSMQQLLEEEALPPEDEVSTAAG